MLTPGAILAHAHNFKKGINCNIDNEEAEKLYSLYSRLTDNSYGINTVQHKSIFQRFLSLFK